MAKSKINQTIRKSVEGVLDLSNGVNIEIEDIGTMRFSELFNKFDGELVKIVVAVSNDGSDEDAEDGE